MRKFRTTDSLPLPGDLDYHELTWVSSEERLLLTEARPATVHAASRIPGIRSSTLMLLFSIANRHARGGVRPHTHATPAAERRRHADAGSAAAASTAGL